MPTKPASADPTYMSIPDGRTIFNTIYDNASIEFKDMIPKAIRDNIKEIGNPIMNNPARRNEFVNLAVMFAFIVVSSKSYNNRLKEFKKGKIEVGETIEEIGIGLIKAEPYYLADPNDEKTPWQDLLERRIPDVRAVFHMRNVQKKIVLTVENQDLRTAFMSWNNLEDFIAKLVEKMYTSDEWQEYLLMKNIFVDAANRGAFYPMQIPNPTDEASLKSAVKVMRMASTNVAIELSTQYNLMGIDTYTTREEQILFILSEFEASMDVEVLASAFNMSKTDFLSRRIVLPDFGGLEKSGVVALLIDRDWFMVYDNLYEVTEQYNGARLYWNYFLHHWYTMSYSPFKTAIAFVTSDSLIDSVTITGNMNVTGGIENEQQLTATVKAANSNSIIFGGVTWSIDDVASKAGVYIYPTGLLTIPANYTGTITVTATSTYDTTKSASVQVVVS